MKRITAFFFFQVFFLSSLCFAQTLTIIGVKGSVQYKDAADKPWQQAKPSVRLGKNAELMTASNAECSLSFEQERKNVITVKADSIIKVENIIPAKIVLTQGRVFSLIKAVSEIEDFQVRTPTATAGVRGSGLGVIFEQAVTSVFCFEDKIFIQALDDKGNIAGEKELGEGSGIIVGAGGVFGESFKLSDKDYKDWETFSRAINRGSPKEVESSDGTIGSEESDTDTKQELREQERESSQDLRQEELRKEEAESASGGGGHSITIIP